MSLPVNHAKNMSNIWLTNKKESVYVRKSYISGCILNIVVCCSLFGIYLYFFLYGELLWQFSQAESAGMRDARMET